MRLFVETVHCTSGANCQTCRALTPAGERFRAYMAGRYNFPAECPRGYALGQAVPAYVPPGEPPPPPPKPAGPGTELKKLLARLGLAPKSGCDCEARARQMDSQGVEWCAANVPEIVGWLESAAKARGLPFSRTLAGVIVRRAIRNARRAVG